MIPTLIATFLTITLVAAIVASYAIDSRNADIERLKAEVAKLKADMSLHSLIACDMDDCLNTYVTDSHVSQINTRYLVAKPLGWTTRERGSGEGVVDVCPECAGVDRG